MKIIKETTMLPYPKSIKLCNPELNNAVSNIPQQWKRLDRHKSEICQNINVIYCSDMKLHDEYKLTVAGKKDGVAAKYLYNLIKHLINKQQEVFPYEKVFKLL